MFERHYYSHSTENIINSKKVCNLPKSICRWGVGMTMDLCDLKHHSVYASGDFLCIILPQGSISWKEVPPWNILVYHYINTINYSLSNSSLVTPNNENGMTAKENHLLIQFHIWTSNNLGICYKDRDLIPMSTTPLLCNQG